jgi:hypothetical protein
VCNVLAPAQGPDVADVARVECAAVRLSKHSTHGKQAQPPQERTNGKCCYRECRGWPEVPIHIHSSGIHSPDLLCGSYVDLEFMFTGIDA